MELRYEGIFILRAKDNENEKKEIITQIDNVVKDEGCEIFKRDEIGVKKLAYNVKGEKTGFYYLINFNVPESFSKGKLSIKINTLEDVLKHIIVKMEE